MPKGKAGTEHPSGTVKGGGSGAGAGRRVRSRATVAGVRSSTACAATASVCRSTTCRRTGTRCSKISATAGGRIGCWTRSGSDCRSAGVECYTRVEWGSHEAWVVAGQVREVAPEVREKMVIGVLGHPVGLAQGVQQLLGAGFEP